MKKFSLIFMSLLSLLVSPHDGWKATKLSETIAHTPSVLPDRVVLTWNDNTATTQSVSWRTDTSVMSGYAQIGVANASGRSMQTNEFKAVTTLFRLSLIHI